MNDIASELAKLHYLSGADFIHQLRLIVSFREFQLIEGETDIYSAIGEDSDDYQSLLNAARKAVSHGYRVFILDKRRRFKNHHSSCLWSDDAGKGTSLQFSIVLQSQPELVQIPG